MARRKNRSQIFEILIGLGVLGAIITFLIPSLDVTPDLTSLFVTMAILIGVLGLGLLIAIKFQENRRLWLLRIDDVGKMSGVEFEQYVGKLLENKGYAVKFTKTSGDLGVDIVANRNDERTGIQIKRYMGAVSRTAISDVVGSMNHYGYAKSMVITTGYFTKDAKTLAESTGCKLVDRREVEKWIVEFQAKRN